MIKMYQITAENQGKFKKSLKDLTKSQINLLDLLASMFFRYGQISPSQQFIANRLGFCRETINRGVAELLDLGLIEVDPQKRKMPGFTCAYRICSWITKDMCKLFCKALKSFRYFHVKYLCSRTDLFNKKKNVTLVNYINNNLLFNNPCIPVGSIRKNVDGEVLNSNRKEFSMQNMDNVVTTEKINEIDQLLGLTLHGKIKLRAFEDKALQYGLNAVMVATESISNKFELIISKAVAYSLEHRIPVNWKRYYSLRDSYKIGSEDRKFLVKEEKKAIKGEKVSYSNKEKVNQRAYSPERERSGEISNRKLAEYKEQQARADHNFVEDIKHQVRMGRLDEKTARERIELRLARAIS